MDALRNFLEDNETEDLRFINLLKTKEHAVSTDKALKTNSKKADDLNWEGLSATDQLYVRNQVLAYQRVLHLGSDYETASALLKAGLDSSVAVSTISYPEFLKKTELTETDAYPVYQKALNRSSQIAHGVQLKKDAISSIEQNKLFQGVDPSFINDLKDLPGYADLFGSTSYCECAHCRSIFSPAAYFADLMYFIETNITNFVNWDKNHPIRLNIRRPDLWKLKLTCANTETLVPHLELVIEILESYLEHSLGVQNVEEKLNFDNAAIGLPFHRPLEAMRQYLSDWNLKLTDIYKVLDAPGEVQLKEQLHLSDEEWDELTASAQNNAWIRFASADHTKMDVVDFLGFAGLSRKELDQLKKTLTAGGFTIVKVKLSNDIQSDKEVIQGLSDALIDQIGRFLRLQRRTGYTIMELDELLQSKRIAGSKEFTEESLYNVARFKRLQESYGLSVESMIAVLDHIPNRAMAAGTIALSETLRLPAFTNGSAFPISFHHAQFNTTAVPDAGVDNRMPALLNLLGINEAVLLSLFGQYKTRFVFDPTGTVELTADHIALLYAHVAFAKAVGITPADLSQVVNKLFTFPDADFRSLDFLEELQQTLGQLNRLPFSVSELFDLLDPSVSRVDQEQVVQLVSDLQKAGTLLFTPSLLTAIPGIKANDALAILTTLSGGADPLIVKEGDKYALTAAYTLIPTPAKPATDLKDLLPAYTAQKDAIHNAFLTFHFINNLPNSLAAIAGLSTDKATIALAFMQPTWSHPAILQALKTPIADGIAKKTSDDLMPLIAVINELSRIGLLFNRLNLESSDYWFIARYPSVFNITDITQLQTADLITIARYKKLRSPGTLSAAEIQNLLWQYHVRANNNQPPAAKPVFSTPITAVPVFAKAVETAAQTVFEPADAPLSSAESLVQSPLNDDEINLLAKQTGLDPILLRSVFLALPLPSNALDGLEQAFRLYSYCTTLRIQGHSLAKLQPRDFTGLKTAGTMLWDSLQTKYPDEKAREKHLSPYNDQLNMLQRDALCDYIISQSETLRFKDRDDLYNYFLIDVEMAGCFRTSRLVAAISSLQLYVYRCLINLEQSEKDNFSVLSFILSDKVSHEWEWRKNYRVWEANRKVFLYPENYMEPDLRDDKTPLFKELEEGLLQRRITLEAAETAYSSYLTGFSEIAQLKIAGSYFYKDTADQEKTCYIFFGRTYNDPYQYYFRRYYTDSKLWEPWVKTDLAISAPSVSPIVHLGRLYIFWIEIVSMETSTFVDGNSLFQGVTHKITLQYSHLQENNRWAPAQKKQLLEEDVVDRFIIDNTPQEINFNQNFKLIAVDPKLTKEATIYYTTSKTYAKVFVTADPADEENENLVVHYYRKRKRTHVTTTKTVVHIDKNNIPVTTDEVTLLPDSEIEVPFLLKSDNIKFEEPKIPIEGFQYFRRRLDLLRNEFVSQEEIDDKRVHDDNTGQDVPQKTEDGFYDASQGTEAIGLFKTDPMTIKLVLRNYAKPENQGATDDMLITEDLKNGIAVSDSFPGITEHDMQFVNNCPEDTILQSWKNQYWIHRNTESDYSWTPRTATLINTTLASYLSGVLFTKGIDQFLTLQTQTTKGEIDFNPMTNIYQLQFVNEPYAELPFKGSHGRYYRELFFHIPFLIANQLNADGQYKEAKFWYEKIFNPTAQSSPDDFTEKDRVWRYQEFRNQNIPQLKAILTDTETIELYKKDPFNPFAIARLRMSAFQKCIVMKYIDNLIDWADDLFTQDTMESINEATMLYVLAYELLGKRPVSTGKCDNADETTLTYDLIGPAIAKGSEFLMYLENVYLQLKVEADIRLTKPASGDVTNASSNNLRDSGLGKTSSYRTQPRFETYNPSSERTAQTDQQAAAPSAGHRDRPDTDFLKGLPVFCVPPNEILIGYWDRLEDRLFKIRNCMNINGERRSLALFQPPIDPMLLVRAKAAGLSIDDIVGQLNEALPPYRFTYLVEKARQYISTVQSFGGALLSALEKKDGEALGDAALGA